MATPCPGLVPTPGTAQVSGIFPANPASGPSRLESGPHPGHLWPPGPFLRGGAGAGVRGVAGGAPRPRRLGQQRRRRPGADQGRSDPSRRDGGRQIGCYPPPSPPPWSAPQGCSHPALPAPPSPALNTRTPKKSRLHRKNMARCQTCKMYRASRAVPGYIFLAWVNVWSEHTRFCRELLPSLGNVAHTA